jgi:hypothetical protein
MPVLFTYHPLHFWDCSDMKQPIHNPTIKVSHITSMNVSDTIQCNHLKASHKSQPLWQKRHNTSQLYGCTEIRTSRRTKNPRAYTHYNLSSNFATINRWMATVKCTLHYEQAHSKLSSPMLLLLPYLWYAVIHSPSYFLCQNAMWVSHFRTTVHV